MTDISKLLAEATPRPWIRPWATLEVRAPGADDLFGTRLTPNSLQQYQLKAQCNLDLAVHAVNALPAYEAAVDALERLADAYKITDGDNPPLCMLCDGRVDHFSWCPIIDARAALRALRGDE